MGTNSSSHGHSQICKNRSRFPYCLRSRWPCTFLNGSLPPHGLWFWLAQLRFINNGDFLFQFCKLVCNLCVRTITTYEYCLSFYYAWLNARLFGVEGVKRLEEMVHEHVDVLHNWVLKDDIHVVPKSLDGRHLWPRHSCHVCSSWVPTFITNNNLNWVALTTRRDHASTIPSLGT